MPIAIIVWERCLVLARRIHHGRYDFLDNVDVEVQNMLHGSYALGLSWATG